MGYRYTICSQDKQDPGGEGWPEWFIKKYSWIQFNKNTFNISLNIEQKFDEFIIKDMHKALNETNFFDRWGDFVLILLGEDGEVEKYIFNEKEFNLHFLFGRGLTDG